MSSVLKRGLNKLVRNIVSRKLLPHNLQLLLLTTTYCYWLGSVTRVLLARYLRSTIICRVLIQPEAAPVVLEEFIFQYSRRWRNNWLLSAEDASIQCRHAVEHECGYLGNINIISAGQHHKVPIIRNHLLASNNPSSTTTTTTSVTNTTSATMGKMFLLCLAVLMNMELIARLIAN